MNSTRAVRLKNRGSNAIHWPIRHVRQKSPLAEVKADKIPRDARMAATRGPRRSVETVVERPVCAVKFWSRFEISLNKTFAALQKTGNMGSELTFAAAAHEINAKSNSERPQCGTERHFAAIAPKSALGRIFLSLAKIRILRCYCVQDCWTKFEQWQRSNALATDKSRHAG